MWLDKYFFYSFTNLNPDLKTFYKMHANTGVNVELLQISVQGRSQPAG